jgi:hypothetical protein
LVELRKIVTSSNNYLVKFLRKSQVVIYIKEKKINASENSQLRENKEEKITDHT